MVTLKAVYPDSGEEKSKSLEQALAQALEFEPARVSELILSEDSIAKYAAQEANYPHVSVDERGITGGMRQHIFNPAFALIAEWKRARAPFDRAIQPFMTKLQAVDKLDNEISTLEGEQVIEREKAISAERDKAKYTDAEAHWSVTKSRYEQLYDEEDRRAANLGAYSPFYWVGILLIGVAEWLINYDTFLLFMGIPAIAAGATIVLGILLAFAAHAHGTLLRQWTAHFGQDVVAAERFVGWRYLALASFSLFLVLLAAGGSRYAAALHALGSSPQINILGNEALIEINPIRDVLLSLLANVAAWAVGVFIAYMAHDRNPKFSEAKREFDKAKRAFDKKRAVIEDRLATINAKYEKRIDAIKKAAQAKARDVIEEKEKRDQLVVHENALMQSVADAVQQNIELYQGYLTNVVLEKAGATTIRQGDAVITPYDYRALEIDGTALLAPSRQ